MKLSRRAEVASKFKVIQNSVFECTQRHNHILCFYRKRLFFLSLLSRGDLGPQASLWLRLCSVPPGRAFSITCWSPIFCLISWSCTCTVIRQISCHSSESKLLMSGNGTVDGNFSEIPERDKAAALASVLSWIPI